MNVRKEYKTAVTYQPNTTGAYRTDGPFTIGGDFSVQIATRLISISWNDPLVAPTTKQVGIWSSTGLLLSTAYITNSAAAQFATPILLIPGNTYRVGVQVLSGESWKDLASVQAAPYPITLGSAYAIAGASLTRPTTPYTGWFGAMVFNLEYSTFDTKVEPPEPTIIATPGAFSISLPKDWLPSNLQEWDLQYQRSADGVTYGIWLDIGTFPANYTPDDGTDDDSDPEAYGGYTDTILDLSVPLPFYRYRYRLRTTTDETQWSEAASAGQLKRGDEPIDGSNIDPGTIPIPDPSEFDGSSFTGINIIDSLLSSSPGNHTSLLGSLIGGTLLPDSLSMSNAATLAVLSGNALTYGFGTFTNTLTAATISNTVSMSTPQITATKYFGTDLSLTGLINGNILSAGVFNGVSINNGAIDGSFIKAKSITADKIQTGSIDSNLMTGAYIDAGFIEGGELSLGGRKFYTNFNAASGALVYPWTIIGSLAANLDAPGILTPPVGAARKLVGTWGTSARTDLVVGASFTLGDTYGIAHVNTQHNRIKSITFTVSSAMPTAGSGHPSFALQLVDENSALRPAVPWTKSAEPTTATVDFTADPLGLPATIAVRLQCTTSGTVPTGVYYYSISNVTITYEKGDGILTIYDDTDTLRAELSASAISFRRPSSANNALVFQVTDTGTWMAQDSLTIGSNRNPTLTYSPRDLSGSLVINPRFENLRGTDPTHIVPSDWTYLSGTSSSYTRDETNIGYEDGIYPQWQSLVSGRVLTMTLPSGWTGASNNIIRAISHKSYVQPDLSGNLGSTVPISFSGYFRTPFQDPDVEVRMYLYSSSTASDIATNADMSSDILLGTAVSFGSNVSGHTADNQVLFQQVSRAFEDSTNVAGDLMSVTQGAYIYVVLEARVRSGHTLSSSRLVEWDNIDLVLSEQLTPSDNQIEADLARRITDLQTLFQYQLSGTKAVLPQLTATTNVLAGQQGLTMTVVT